MKDELKPVVVKDADSGKVLMLAYANQEALKKSKETKKAWFWSRGRKKLWMKGEESGNTMELKAIYEDCDRDALMYLVKPAGPACHKGTETCFTKVWGEGNQEDIFAEVMDVIAQRKRDKPKGSYVAEIIGDKAKIAEKIMEEAEEVVKALKGEPDGNLVHEVADVIFFCMVALGNRGIEWKEVRKELRERRK
ncbi:MAG: bifunctional phosphoribosyl-AMP cyclohydrolase/phosphoribosyl-ATP diphosphatase HisIE [archaeon]